MSLAERYANKTETLTNAPVSRPSGLNFFNPSKIPNGSSARIRFLPLASAVEGQEYDVVPPCHLWSNQLILTFQGNVGARVPLLTTWGEKDPLLDLVNDDTVQPVDTGVFYGFVREGDRDNEGSVKASDGEVKIIKCTKVLTRIINDQAVEHVLVEKAVYSPVAKDGGKDFRITKEGGKYATSRFEVAESDLTQDEIDKWTAFGVKAATDLERKPDDTRQEVIKEMVKVALRGGAYDESWKEFYAGFNKKF